MRAPIISNADAAREWIARAMAHTHAAFNCVLARADARQRDAAHATKGCLGMDCARAILQTICNNVLQLL
eukprot:10936363-Lingulodinium_polyedra.AAC.1